MNSRYNDTGEQHPGLHLLRPAATPAVQLVWGPPCCPASQACAWLSCLAGCAGCALHELTELHTYSNRAGQCYQEWSDCVLNTDRVCTCTSMMPWWIDTEQIGMLTLGREALQRCPQVKLLWWRPIPVCWCRSLVAYQLLHVFLGQRWHPKAADQLLPSQALWQKPEPLQRRGHAPTSKGAPWEQGRCQSDQGLLPDELRTHAAAGEQWPAEGK